MSKQNKRPRLTTSQRFELKAQRQFKKDSSKEQFSGQDLWEFNDFIREEIDEEIEGFYEQV